MRKYLKRIFVYFLIAVGLLLSINSIRMLILANEIIDVNEENTAGYVNAPGGHSNCFAFVKKNGLKTAPFVLGYSMYLYDIENDKEYYLLHTNRLFQRFEKNYCFRNGFIYFERTGIDGERSQDIEKYDIKTRVVSDFASLGLFTGRYSLADDYIIYTSSEGDGGFECLVKLNMRSGEKVFILPPEKMATFSFVEVHGNTIYTGEGDEVFRFDLNTCKYLGKGNDGFEELQQLTDEEDAMIAGQFPENTEIVKIRKEVLEDYYVYDVLYVKTHNSPNEKTKVFVFDKKGRFIKSLSCL